MVIHRFHGVLFNLWTKPLNVATSAALLRDPGAWFFSFLPGLSAVGQPKFEALGTGTVVRSMKCGHSWHSWHSYASLTQVGCLVILPNLTIVRWSRFKSLQHPSHVQINQTQSMVTLSVFCRGRSILMVLVRRCRSKAIWQLRELFWLPFGDPIKSAE